MPALKGLVQETEELMSEARNPDVLDAGLIGCAHARPLRDGARYGTKRGLNSLTWRTPPNGRPR
jgi:ferritin-like metal-binding protein YciE